MSSRTLALLFCCGALAGGANRSQAQLVVLPAPRLLAVFPMGVQAGTAVEVTVTGENIDENPQLVFSSPKLTAEPKKDEKGQVVQNRFLVTAAADAPSGLYEARLMTRLGVSSSRCFSVGTMREVSRTKPNITPETALELSPGAVCNAYTTARNVDYYTVRAGKGARLLFDCTTTGIDSRLTPVLLLSDTQGRELLAERRTAFIDFTAPEEGTYTLKVHGLTYQGGPENFYRLAVSELAPGKPVKRQPVTASVSASSVPKIDPVSTPFVDETEPNNKGAQAQKIQLPCAIRGAFATAGDVDTYQFEAKKGEVWWVEAVSSRLGLPTDPFVVIQKVGKGPEGEVLSDVAELNDIPSPVKLSSAGYAYDGVPYDVGTPDCLGKFECKEDGVYRLQIRDLFGGTRSDPGNVYQLVLRNAAPDFSLVHWAMHMELRNGDRANLSKPVALRGGATMAFDVVALRRDGFDGEIQIEVENLPPGVMAVGLRIPPGKSLGTLLLTATEEAPRGFSIARVFGRAQINGVEVRHECPSASMAWPVKDHSAEVPAPRLFADVPVSVGGAEKTPLSILPSQNQPYEVVAGQKATIPIKMLWRGDFSSGPVKLKPLGADFAALPAFDVGSKSPQSEVVIDLASIKLPPGDYAFALHGGVVSKYSYNPGAVKVVEEEQKEVERKAAEVAAELQKTAAAAKEAPPEKAAEVQALAKAVGEKMKAMEAAKADVLKRMKTVADVAAPKEIADIVVSEPIRVRVKPSDSQ
jgi:hypothetical protein